MTTATALPTEQILEAFKKWINARPNLNRADYGAINEKGSFRAYWSELQRIKKQGTEARKALKEAMSYPFNPEAMQDALTRAFSGRLSWNGDHFEYVTGQYYPTEYRAAARAVLASYCDIVRPKVAPSPSDSFYSIEDIRAAAKRAGSHWFNKDTLRFFRSRVYPEIIRHGNKVYFISSEQFTDDYRGFKADRKYTVRVFDCTDGDIGTVGEFQAYATKAQALNAARSLVKSNQH